MKKLLLILTITLFMVSCGSTKSIKYDSVKKYEFTILKVEHKKNSFLVDLKQKHGKVHRDVFVAKKCETWQLYRKGDVVKLKLGTYIINGEKFYDFMDIKETLCK